MDLVTRMAPLWRLAGNPDFDRSLEWIEAQLAAAGITTRYDTIPSTSQGWEMRDAEIRLDSAQGESGAVARAGSRPARHQLVLDAARRPARAARRRRRRHRARPHYDGKDIAGAVVLADGSIGDGVDPGGEGPRRGRRHLHADRRATRSPSPRRRCCSGEAFPYAADTPSFGFKATPRAPKRLRERLAAGAVQVQVQVDTVFHRRPVRTPGGRVSGRALAGRSRGARRARPGAGGQRQRQRMRHAARRCARDPARDRGQGHPAARAHADADLGRREPRQRRVDRGGSGSRPARRWR